MFARTALILIKRSVPYVAEGVFKMIVRGYRISQIKEDGQNRIISTDAQYNQTILYGGTGMTKKRVEQLMDLLELPLDGGVR